MASNNVNTARIIAINVMAMKIEATKEETNTQYIRLNREIKMLSDEEQVEELLSFAESIRKEVIL